jgi:hypothetical protein
MATRDPERYFDRRTLKRHLKRGLVSEADINQFLESLPDVTDKIKPRDEGGDDDGFDGRGKLASTHEGPIIKTTPVFDLDAVSASFAERAAAVRSDFARDEDYDDDDDDDDDDDGDDGDDGEDGKDAIGGDTGGDVGGAVVGGAVVGGAVVGGAVVGGDVGGDVDGDTGGDEPLP